MKQRIQLSLNPELVKIARQLARENHFDSVSEFVEALIREEDKRAGRITPPVRYPHGEVSGAAMNEPGKGVPPQGVSPASGTGIGDKAVDYLKNRARKRRGAPPGDRK